MGKIILGISGFYHDSGAALTIDGSIVAAAQEERFSRKKHDPRFPKQAINYCLQEAFIEADELDAVAFYDNPLLTFDRLVHNALAVAPRGKEVFIDGALGILGKKMWVNDYVRQAIGSLGKVGKVLFCEHHMAHAASAFYPSPFTSAAILVMDGVGEWATTSLGVGKDENIELFAEINYPHSLGLLYSAMTYFCGFKVNSGEYKLMGLAPYGEPRYYSRIREHLIDIREDGSYRLNTDYFGYLDGKVMTNEAFHALFDGPPRKPESRITRREMDLAASVQKITEEVVLRTARHLRKSTGERNLVMAGGVALNCVANGKLLAEKIFDQIWIQPAAGDAGGAIGAALLVHHLYFGEKRKIQPGRDGQKGSLLGPSYSSESIRAMLDRKGYPYHHIQNRDERLRLVAQAIADGKIVGWFSNRMEFGPRALGARSILGDPRNPNTQSVMNLKIKYRESFRPFAPSVLLERVSEYFEMDVESPYMLLVAPVKKERCKPMDLERFRGGDDDMLPVINQVRSDIPAVTHVDYSARIQTVRREDNPDYYDLIKAFEAITGYGVIVNTSFNVRGEPIVCTPLDAYRCFMRTEMDLLVLEDCLLYRNEQPQFEDDENWREKYELD
ncbi:MAG: carbamoyltransferase [Sandaracinaceae bacterium]|nr:carbamoyltransferase [Sandaracinaceae bacterium]